VTDPFAIGDQLPGSIQAWDAGRIGEVVYWVPDAAALAVGDVLLGRPEGLRLCPASWTGDRLDEVRASLRPVLDLPIQMILTAHGPAVLADGRQALERALG
jgi:glyoxylase-like metal-dependent hydrolase (beta-lactamase superfamily II)